MLKIFKKFIFFFLRQNSRNIGFKVFIGEDINNLKQIYSLTPRKFRVSCKRPLQIADPFIFEDFDCKMWLFFEEKTINNPGIIKCLSLENEKIVNEKIVKEKKIDLGINCHLSFPFIFKEKEQYFMMPETAELNEIGIYECLDFPIKWRKKLVLFKGKYVDSSICKIGDLYYLFTTKKIETSDKYQFELYFSKEIFGSYQKHPTSPISCGKKYSRLGGAIINIEGKYFRVSQDCEISYGRELNLFEILEISENNYSEKLIHNGNWIKKLFNHKYGGHHVSTINTKNGKYWAFDFNYKDAYFQRIINLFHENT